jgi:hypothetical protein
MLKSEPSFASLLVKQSPGMHYGHGWIAGKDGKRWHRAAHRLIYWLASLPKAGGIMAIEAVSATVPLKAGERLAGLNHVAELRARYWGDSWKEVERFVDDMRDKRDPQFEENNRALAAIFFLAKIPAARHELELSELTTDEKKRLLQR